MRAVELLADSGQRHLDKFLGKVHHHLACIGYLAAAALGKEQVGTDAVVRRHSVGYHFEVHLVALDFYGIRHHPLGKVERYVAVEDGSVSKK